MINMIKNITIEAKNLKEAEEKATQQLNYPIEKINLELIKESKGFLGIGASVTYDASVEIDVALETKEYLKQILDGLDIEYKMESRTVENEIYFNISSSSNPLLIGKEGRTLDAIQTLVKNFVMNMTTEKIIVSVDCGDYKENRKRQLEILATKVAKDVARSKIPVKLKPMSAFERRIIHTKLSEWRDVYTESEGEGEDRALVIKPKNN